MDTNRAKPFWDYAHANNMRRMWLEDIQGVGSIYCMSGNGKVFMFQEYRDRDGNVDGWEIYVPVSRSGNIDETLGDLEEWLKS